MLLMSPEVAFQVLNISGNVTPEEIKQAYRITALRCHPDRYIDLYDKERARVLFLQAANAYRSLIRAGYIFPLSFHTTLPSMSQTLNNHDTETKPVHLTSPPSIEYPYDAIKNRGLENMHGRQSPLETSPVRNRTHHFGSIPNKDDPTVWKSFASFLSRSRVTSPNVEEKLVVPHVHDLSPPNAYQTDIHSSPCTPSLDPPYAIPLQSVGFGIGGEWTYSLSLSLEEIFFGQRCRFRITRTYLSKQTKSVVIEIQVPPGCRPGTRIVCRHVGHEFRPGVFQDIAFVVEEAKHNRFARLFDDLVAEVRLPHIRKKGDKLSFTGIDGESLAVHIDHPKDRQTRGSSVIQGAGMPIRERGRVVGRGNLVVQWEVVPNPSETTVFHFLRRLIGRT